jgi:hypothetical protein
MFFSGLDDFEGLGGLDKKFAANSGVGPGKLLMAGVLMRLEHRDRGIRGKATATTNAMCAMFSQWAQWKSRQR